jgi:hypothetical protein
VSGLEAQRSQFELVFFFCLLKLALGYSDILEQQQRWPASKSKKREGIKKGVL